MKIRWSPAQEKIIAPLRDMSWHCLFSEIVMKDDRKRISEINEKLSEQGQGYKVIGKLCDGRCGIRHSSRIFMRRIVKEMHESGVLERMLIKKHTHYRAIIPSVASKNTPTTHENPIHDTSSIWVQGVGRIKNYA